MVVADQDAERAIGEAVVAEDGRRDASRGSNASEGGYDA